MDLSVLQNLPVEDKLNWLQSKVGLKQLNAWLSEGNSLRKIAQLMSIDGKTVYRWIARYSDLAEVVALYKPVKAVMADPVDYTRGLAYRIIYAYDGYGAHFKGCIMEEFTTPEELWASIFVQQYFSSFKKSEVDYLSAYLAAMQSTGVFKLSNWYLLTYCEISRKGVIKPLKKPV